VSLTTTSSASATTAVCINRYYSFTHGCRQETHSITKPQAGQTYVITKVPSGAQGVDEYQIVQNNQGGGTTQVADRTINSTVPRYVLVLTDLWSSQGAKVTPGSYELITISGKTSTKYPLTVEASSPKPTKT